MMNADQAVPLRTLRGCMCELGSDEVLESIVRVSQEIDSGELSSVVRMCAQPTSGTSFSIFRSYRCAPPADRAVASRIPNNVMNHT
jgi:hypothetical protein